MITRIRVIRRAARFRRPAPVSYEEDKFREEGNETSCCGDTSRRDILLAMISGRARGHQLRAERISNGTAMMDMNMQRARKSLLLAPR